MRKSVKRLIPVPKGHIILLPNQDCGKTMWLNRDQSGYEHRLLECADGTTALYLIKPNGRIVPDMSSIVVRDPNSNAGGHICILNGEEVELV